MAEYHSLLGGVDTTVSNNFSKEKDWDVQQTGSFADGQRTDTYVPKKIPEGTVIPLLTSISEISKFIGVWEKEKQE